MPHRVTFNGPLAWSALALAVTTVALLSMLWPVVVAAVAPGAGTQEVDEKFASLLQRHEDDQERYKDRFDGRSIFFTPRQPAPPIVRRDPEPVRTPVVTTPTPPPPRDYTGPSIRAILGSEVWFHDNLRLSVGEEGQGVKVLAVNPPWSARLEYAGGEFDVSLFEPTPDDFFGRAIAAAGPTGLIEAPPEQRAPVEAGEPAPAEEGGTQAPPTEDDDEESGRDDEGEGGDDESETPEESPESAGETPPDDPGPVRPTSPAP